MDDLCRDACPDGLVVGRTDRKELAALVGKLGPDDLLITFAAGTRSEQSLWPVGVAGDGFDGNLTSDSTRTDGVALPPTSARPSSGGWGSTCRTR